jgi:DNA-binding transcriptional LysR family regulator
MYSEFMNIESYRTLLAIEELGSFSLVARRQNMTLSAVSMQMKTLERELDVQIFDRTMRPPRLTPLGRDLAKGARRIISAQDELIALTRAGGALRGKYRIGFIATASVRLLPGFLAKARGQAVEAEFMIETGLSETLQNRVASGQLDAAVVTRSGVDNPQLIYSTICREDLVFALPARYGGKDAEVCMAELPFILFTPNSGIGRLVSRHLAVQGHVPCGTMILDSVEAIMECVNAGIGVTILPKPDVERYAKGAVEMAVAGAEPLRREISIVTTRGGIVSQQIEAFLDLFTF